MSAAFYGGTTINCSFSANKPRLQRNQKAVMQVRLSCCELTHNIAVHIYNMGNLKKSLLKYAIPGKVGSMRSRKYSIAMVDKSKSSSVTRYGRSKQVFVINFENVEFNICIQTSFILCDT
ncbi:hypothetical protein DOY81_006821 [Sarcophaga bullata]|nr:hypothetical protein DOY81_006821 [Sarcophaga bullata]